jgi:hypothetical protein
MGTRRMKRSNRGTRKASGGLSVAALHASFEKMDNKVRAAIGRGVSDAELAACIRDQWSGLFHGAMSPAAVRGMVMHYRALYGAGPRRTRKRQRGGMAPMGWTLGQGVSDAVYGRFPVDMGATPRVVASLDRFYESPVSRACDSTGGHDAPTASQEGGGLLDSLAAGHAPASVPRNIVEQGISAVQGAPIQDPPADPTMHTWQLQNPPPAIFDPKPISNLAGLAPIYNPV